MPPAGINLPFALDVTTLFVVVTCVTGLLGVLLLFAWVQDRVTALAWWGTAYLIGGFSVVLWSVESHISPPLPAGIANALLFVACGMVWNAARLFHGRGLLWSGLAAGAVVWLVACLTPAFVGSTVARIVLSSFIVSVYTFLTAAELWRERRKHRLGRWPAIVVPLLHGLVFLCPIPLAYISPSDAGIFVLANGWLSMFTLEIMLYVVGTAFIMLVLSKERSVRLHRDAASTDELTGLLNRRGFVPAAQALIERFKKRREPVSALMFDLDHFKRVNDGFGHATGDEALRLFASVAATTLRASDILGRWGGEEFVAVLPGSMHDAAVAAERVRVAFETAAATSQPVCVTVSVGVASGECGTDVMMLIAAADNALYKAKRRGRNRVELAEEGTLAPVDGRPGAVPAPSHPAPSHPAPSHPAPSHPAPAATPAPEPALVS